MTKRAILNVEILERLKEKYGVSKRFISMSINGDRTSETSDKIKADYKTMEKAQKDLLAKL